MPGVSPPAFVLASGSPRRHELLRGLGLNFRVVVPEVDESLIPSESPAAACERLSAAKAAAVAARCGNGHCDDETTIIAADTIVVADGEILGKPADRDDSLRMLRLLRGRDHEVLTGLSVFRGKIRLSVVERTVVTFRPLSEADMTAYADCGEGADKAGGYAIQGRGALLVSGIEGDYFNVVGLPLCRLALMFEELGLFPSAFDPGAPENR